MKSVSTTAVAAILASVILSQVLSFSSARAVDGGSMAGGGGNTVGETLFDDYENQGSVKINSDEVAKYAQDVIGDLDQKIPQFAIDLRLGIKGVEWFQEPKILDQKGFCKNGSETGLTPPIDQVVRACQTKLSVRIEQKWYVDKFQTNPALLSGLIVHELLVFHRLRNKEISEEGVLRISRDIRSKQMTADQLKKELSIAGFGDYLTKQDIIGQMQDTYRSGAALMRQYCGLPQMLRGGGPGNDLWTQFLGKRPALRQLMDDAPTKELREKGQPFMDDLKKLEHLTETDTQALCKAVYKIR
jgi:hypothetical protein